MNWITDTKYITYKVHIMDGKSVEQSFGEMERLMDILSKIVLSETQINIIIVYFYRKNYFHRNWRYEW